MRFPPWVIFLLLALVADTNGGSAQSAERTISLDRFHADVVVGSDGVTDVTETLDVRFEGEWNGVIRDISLQHRTGQGRAARLTLEVQAVTDGDGNELRVEESGDRENRRVQIWVPGATDAVRTVRIHYRIPNAIRFFGSDAPSGPHEELYWNVTGNRWTMPIRRASARFELPESVGPVEAWAYTGVEGSTASNATVQVRGRTVDVARDRELAPGEGLTVSVNWPPGGVAAPSGLAVTAGRIRGAWPLAIPFLALVLMTRRWLERGRDPRKRAVTVQYEPVADLSPAEMGTLLDHRADREDLTATLVDLAVRRYVSVEERSRSRFLGLGTARDYVFHLRRSPDEWNELELHERRYLRALFPGLAMAGVDLADAARSALSLLPRGLQTLLSGHPRAQLLDVTAGAPRGGGARPGSTSGSSGGDAPPKSPDTREPLGPPIASVELSELENKFYTHLEGIRNAIYDQLVRKGYYGERPDKVKGAHLAGAGILGGLGVGGAIWVADGGPFLADPLPLLAAGLLSGAVVAGFALVMPARTPMGARARESALGFREFLQRVETERYRRMITSPELFERYLPYAMAFGVEDRWAEAFQDMVQQPPGWYQGDSRDGFRTDRFTRDLGRMASKAGSTMSSSPSSSGSGGGGSSGGGSGGGGGSGF